MSTIPITKAHLKQLIRQSDWKTIGEIFNFTPRYHFGKIAPPAFFDWGCVPQAVYDVLKTGPAVPKPKPVPKEKKKSQSSGSERLRVILFREQNGLCYYCKRPTEMHQWTIEHRLPRCRGGTHEKGNKVGACRGCNNAKGYLTEAEFMALNPLNVVRLAERAKKAMKELQRVVPVLK